MAEEGSGDWPGALPPPYFPEERYAEVEIDVDSIPTNYIDLIEMLSFRERPYVAAKRFGIVPANVLSILAALLLGSLLLDVILRFIKPPPQRLKPQNKREPLAETPT